ncbi:MAG: radical SAM protein [Planctomycetes bacterium]|nr:radical SAM protein [Planctomycetota bacterium]
MIILYNPKIERKGKQRLPKSLLALAAVLKDDYVIIDGNLNDNAYESILHHINNNEPPHFLGVTVMGGPSLKRAYEDCKRIKKQIPDLTIIWGGYFPTIFPDCVVNSDFVDFVIRGQGEFTQLELIDACKNGKSFSNIDGLSYKENGEIKHNRPRTLVSLDLLPRYPYEAVDVNKYLVPTFLGNRTISHSSSIGCPYRCNFCGVVNMYNSHWLAESAERTANTITLLKDSYLIDAVEFHDSNFFVSEARTVEFCDRVAGLNISWFGEGRIDTLLKYSYETWLKMKKGGCRMIYLGAESGSDEILQRMDKGLTTQQTVDLNKRCKSYGIIPYFFFVVGNPYDPEKDIRESIDFIYHLKKDNPSCEILLCLYTPIPLPGMYEDAVSCGFKYPDTLEEWVSERWENFDERHNPQTLWLKPHHKRLVENFGLVLGARYPTITERISLPYRRFLKMLGSWRYHLRFFHMPIELKLAFKYLYHQRQNTSITNYSLGNVGAGFKPAPTITIWKR